jgi:glycosyltransferase involved in cell wall biosynthesis
MRFVWNPEAYLEKERIGPASRWALSFVLKRLKAWDLRTASRAHHFVAISEHIRRRIQSAYGRDSEVIYPPVDTSQFSVSSQVEDYFLIVSRLNAYKRIDVAIEAFNKLALPLIIIGSGPQEAVLKAAAGKTVRFLGPVSQKELASYMSRCRAFIFPGEEDFGIAPVEAMASGRPVIAFGRGGALETVLEGKTGLFFQEAGAESLREAVRRFMRMEFSPLEIRRQAAKFDKEIFKRRISEFIGRTCGLQDRALF